MNDRPRDRTLRLSAGEFACVLGLRHDEQYGLDLLKMQLGILGDDDARLVMNASSHSLLARRLLSVDGEMNFTLDAEVDALARHFVESSWMLQFNREAGEEVTFLSFHFGGGSILRQSTADEVVHELELLPSFRQLTDAASAFYDAPAEGAGDFPTIELLSVVVAEIRDSRDADLIRHRLEQSGVPEHALGALAEDFLGQRFRGSLVRVDHHEGGTSVSQHAFFVLRGAERLWLLHPKTSAAGQAVTVTPATRHTLADAIKRAAQLPSPFPPGE